MEHNHWTVKHSSALEIKQTRNNIYRNPQYLSILLGPLILIRLLLLLGREGTEGGRDVGVGRSGRGLGRIIDNG